MTCAHLEADDKGTIFPVVQNPIMVCLCEGDDEVLFEFGSARSCDKHQAVTLRSLCESGLLLQLHFMNAEGEVVPVTEDMIRGQG